MSMLIKAEVELIQLIQLIDTVVVICSTPLWRFDDALECALEKILGTGILSGST